MTTRSGFGRIRSQHNINVYLQCLRQILMYSRVAPHGPAVVRLDRAKVIWMLYHHLSVCIVIVLAIFVPLPEPRSHRRDLFNLSVSTA